MDEHKILICRVCHNYLRQPIRQCSKDTKHNFCSQCIEDTIRFPDCVICGGSIPVKMNATLETLLFSANYPCKYSKFGCNVQLPLSKKGSHEMECTHKGHRCEFARFMGVDCQWKGASNQIQKHFATHTGSTADFTNPVVSLPMKLNQSSRIIRLIRQHNELFWFKQWIDFNNEKVYLIFQLIGSKQMASQFSYKIELFSTVDAKCAINFSEECFTDNEDVMQLFQSEKCGVMSFKKISNIIVNDQLAMKYSIQKMPDLTQLKISNISEGAKDVNKEKSHVKHHHKFAKKGQGNVQKQPSGSSSGDKSSKTEKAKSHSQNRQMQEKKQDKQTTKCPPNKNKLSNNSPEKNVHKEKPNNLRVFKKNEQ